MLSPESHDFGSRQTGTSSAAFGFTLSNTGGSQLASVGIGIVGTDASQFAISATTCGSTLGPGASCTINVVHAPTAAGTHSAMLQVTSSDPGGADTATLSGIATPPPGSVTITLDALPNGARDFHYSGGLGAFVLDDDGDATHARTATFADLAAGQYSVTQASVRGWSLTDLSCTTGDATDLVTRTVLITLTGGENVTCTFTTARRHPDSLIALTAAGRYKGQDIYSRRPVPSQTQTRRDVRAGQTYTYFIHVQNDSPKSDSFRLKGARSGASSMTVTFRVHGADVTRAILAGTFNTRSLAPGRQLTVEIRVAVARRATGSAAMTVLLRASSRSTSGSVDVVRAITKR